MGKPTGFLEYSRRSEPYEPVAARLKHWKSFVARLDDAAAGQQAARCMDCGIPFCHNGCPVNNVIPDWNDLVYRGDWKRAILALHATNNFPEFTGRICPAPCEAACTLNINQDAVGIKSIERAIIDKAWEQGWIAPQPAARQTGKKVAIIGSGPAGLACAQQLARMGHAVTVFEKNSRIGGLLRYGIPDFKLDKDIIDRRLEQMAAEGVEFRTGVRVGSGSFEPMPADHSQSWIAANELRSGFDAVVLACGSEIPRDLPVPGRELGGVHFALEYLIGQNRAVAGDGANAINAKGKHVIVIGGGDTGSDCVGTANRQGAASVTQLEVMPMPPEQENRPLTWPFWPMKLRTSSSHEEGCTREFAVGTQSFTGENGRVTTLNAVRLDWSDGKMREIPGSEFTLQADLVFLAMGFVHPAQSVLEAFGVERDARQNAHADLEGPNRYATSQPGIFAAGDVRRGQSLVVWAIREGRKCADAVNIFLQCSKNT